MTSFAYNAVFVLVAQLGTSDGNISAESPVAPAQIQQVESTAKSDSESAPDTMVWVRISKRYLEDYVGRNVDRTKPVRDLILGTRIVGESRTTGKTRLVLHPSDSKAHGEIEFAGKVHAQTRGYNGPATLRYLSNSTFLARKPLVIDENGLSALAAVGDAPTRLTPTSIHVNLPGMRGRIGHGIASRRVARTRSQADAIASDHTADDIRHDLNRKANEMVAKIQKTIGPHIATLKSYGGARPLVMRSRSTPDYIEVAMFRSGADAEERHMQPTPVEGSPDIALRVHLSILTRALSDPKLRDKMAPMLGKVVPVLLAGETATLLPLNDESPSKSTKWSIDAQWVSFDFTLSTGEQSEFRVALEQEQRGRRIR